MATLPGLSVDDSSFGLERYFDIEALKLGVEGVRFDIEVSERGVEDERCV